MMRGNLEGHLLYSTPSELLVTDNLSHATRRLLGSFSLAKKGLDAETVTGAKYGSETASAALTAFFASGQIFLHFALQCCLKIPGRWNAVDWVVQQVSKA